jgi:dTDP-4-amino-4,6-dideoxygalactose transaminase
MRMRARTLPPTAASLGIRDLASGAAGWVAGSRYLERLKAEIAESFGVRHVWLVSSGKAALALILASLTSLSTRRRVVIPAYTCFSVPAAVVKAGLDVALCDVDPATLDFDRGLDRAVDERTLGVVVTHLFGLPSDVDRARALARERGAYVVEDAAQAMGGTRKGRRLGTLGDAAFFSMGRGKNITSGSGGVILTDSDEIAGAVEAGYRRLKAEAPARVMKNFLGVGAMSVLLHPRLYGLPASIPALGLGNTVFPKEIPIHRLDGVRAGLLARWHERLERSNRARVAHANDYLARLTPRAAVIRSQVGDETVYLRLPLLLRDSRAKRELCAASDREGLGVSPMYPSAVQDIPELAGVVGNVECPGARLVAERLVTLPVHPFVRPKDRETIAHLVNVLHGDVPETGRRPALRLASGVRP